MKYILQTKVNEESDTWNNVIDVNKSQRRVQAVPKLFASEQEAVKFAVHQLRLPQSRYQVIEDES